MLGMFFPPPQVSDPNMHLGTCITHMLWCMQGLLTSSFLWSRWRGKLSRYSQHMRNPQFCISGKRPKGKLWDFIVRNMHTSQLWWQLYKIIVNSQKTSHSLLPWASYGVSLVSISKQKYNLALYHIVSVSLLLHMGFQLCNHYTLSTTSDKLQGQHWGSRSPDGSEKVVGGQGQGQLE